MCIMGVVLWFVLCVRKSRQEILCLQSMTQHLNTDKHKNTSTTGPKNTIRGRRSLWDRVGIFGLGDTITNASFCKYSRSNGGNLHKLLSMQLFGQSILRKIIEIVATRSPI